ncbi:MAG TPA: hypothetical protein VKU19_01390 [Bryobacteraceae bacterium]|nr:hypothetical protein [Bryobacteraceae bacterium]
MSLFRDSGKRMLLAMVCLAACNHAQSQIKAKAETAGFRTRELPFAAFGIPYRATLGSFVDGRCIDGGLSFAIVDGVLPQGLELRADVISGIPEELGAFAFRLRASNNCSAQERDFLVQVTGRPVLSVTPREIEAVYRVGGPAPEWNVLLVSASWPRLPYDLTRGNSPWFRTSKQNGSTPPPGSPFAGDTVRVQFVPDKLAPGTYEDTLVFSGPLGATPVSVPVRLRVVPAGDASIGPSQ